LPSQEPGVSLPESSEPVAELPSSVTDGGLYWLRKSYQRAKEQAREEGRSLEEVAVERWGVSDHLLSKPFHILQVTKTLFYFSLILIIVTIEFSYDVGRSRKKMWKTFNRFKV